MSKKAIFFMYFQAYDYSQEEVLKGHRKEVVDDWQDIVHTFDEWIKQMILDLEEDYSSVVIINLQLIR